MRRRSRTYACALAALAFGLGAHATAYGQASVSTDATRFFVDTVQENPCTGEPVAVTGSVQAVSHDTVDASGGETSINFGAFHGTAVGVLSGTRYIVQNVQLDNEGHFSATGADETTDVFSIKFLSPGPGGDFLFFAMHHTTVDANGELQGSPFLFRTECAA